MLYVMLINGHAEPAAFAGDFSELRLACARGEAHPDLAIECRGDWKTFEDAQRIAALLNATHCRIVGRTEVKFIATDAGSNVSPRYDVQELPRVGDFVSKGFNGDYYPVGTIKSISAGPAFRKITTEDGSTFWRVKQTGCWREGGTWSMVKGRHDERNPSF